MTVKQKRVLDFFIDTCLFFTEVELSLIKFNWLKKATKPLQLPFSMTVTENWCKDGKK